MEQPRLKAIYQTRRKPYEIDTCEPQVRAVQEGKIKLHALTKGHYPGAKFSSDILPGLNSIGFWDGAGPQDWGLNEHRNEGVEIVFLETGRMAFTVDKRQFDLGPGSLTITRPWQLHKLGNPNIGPGRLHWLILDVGVRRPNQEWRWPDWLVLTRPDLAELTRKLRHNETPVWKSTGDIAQNFQKIAQCILDWNQPHSVSRMIAKINQLFVSILDALTAQQLDENPDLTSRRRTVELFLKDLAENPVSSRELWTLGQMAQQCGMGVTAFSKYSRELVNVGPMEYLNQCRLDHAARQLREKPELSVTDIAFANGFNSSQYFATCFRRRFKLTPSQFLVERRG
jgi:AraC-like DNA-binding protein/mannose-6-phosphate isomerase-like protein (cupin superfamily)